MNQISNRLSDEWTDEIPNVTIDGITDGNLVGSTDRFQDETAVGKTDCKLVSSKMEKKKGQLLLKQMGLMNIQSSEILTR